MGPRPSTQPEKDKKRSLRGIGYVVAMAAVTLIGSAFMIGGIVAGASGWGAVLLAAVIPFAAFVWALTIAVFDRADSQHRPVPDANEDPNRSIKR